MVFIEELEIVLILIPLILASHALEAVSAAAAIGITASVSLAVSLRKGFERFVVGRMRYLKVPSGIFLIRVGNGSLSRAVRTGALSGLVSSR